MLPAWQRAVRDLTADREHGASVLATRALAALAAAWRDAPGDDADAVTAAVTPLARALRAARPSMPVVANVVNHAMDRATHGARAPTATAARDRGAAAVDAVLDEATQARGNAAKRAAEQARGTVLTISASETVLKALRAASRTGRLRRVVAAEGRPGLEGRDLARALAEADVDVTLIVDAAIGLHVVEADVVLVGADAVLPDGSVINKVGTYLAALAARERDVPFYAVADRFKVAASAELSLEEKGAAEVKGRALPGVRARNIYFDRTPAALVTGVVMDHAVVAPADVAPLAASAAERAGWEARVRRARRGGNPAPAP